MSARAYKELQPAFIPQANVEPICHFWKTEFRKLDHRMSKRLVGLHCTSSHTRHVLGLPDSRSHCHRDGRRVSTAQIVAAAITAAAAMIRPLLMLSPPSIVLQANKALLMSLPVEPARLSLDIDPSDACHCHLYARYPRVQQRSLMRDDRSV